MNQGDRGQGIPHVVDKAIGEHGSNVDQWEASWWSFSELPKLSQSKPWTAVNKNGPLS